MSTATQKTSRRPAARAAALYDGRDLIAIVKRHTDGWHVLMGGRHDLGVALPTRAMAIAMADARHHRIAAAPLAGEHEADAKRVNRIRFHQDHAQARRERRRAT